MAKLLLHDQQLLSFSGLLIAFLPLSSSSQFLVFVHILIILWVFFTFIPMNSFWLVVWTGKEDGKSCQKVTVRMTIRKNDCRSNRPVNTHVWLSVVASLLLASYFNFAFLAVCVEFSFMQVQQCHWLAQSILEAVVVMISPGDYLMCTIWIVNTKFFAAINRSYFNFQYLVFIVFDIAHV